MADVILSDGIDGLFGLDSPLSIDLLETSGFNPPECYHLPECPQLSPFSSPASGKIAVSIEELQRRVTNVKITTDFNNVLANVSLHGWKWKSDCRAFSIFSRNIPNANGATVADAQVLAMGTVSGGRALERLVSLMRTPNENEYNKVMQKLYHRDFIYGSLVYATPSDSTTLGDGSLLSVKTCAFARSHRFSQKKNHQMCFVEHFRPTKDGFAIVFLSVPQHEVLVGKAKGKYVDEVCPYRGWLLVEKAPESRASVRILYHAAINPDFLNLQEDSLTLGFCSIKTTSARLLHLAKGICRLGEVLHQQRRKDCSKGRAKIRNNNSNTERHGADVSIEVSNSHCVACTSKFDLLRRRRRCGLCAYNACTKCCYREPMIIYDRYAATIQFCARCRECMQGGEYPHLRLATGRNDCVENSETSVATSR